MALISSENALFADISESLSIFIPTNTSVLQSSVNTPPAVNVASALTPVTSYAARFKSIFASSLKFSTTKLVTSPALYPYVDVVPAVSFSPAAFDGVPADVVESESATKILASLLVILIVFKALSTC